MCGCGTSGKKKSRSGKLGDLGARPGVAKMRNYLIVLTAILFAASFSVSSQAEIITIDSFDDSWELYPSAIDEAETQIDTGLIDVLGGSRETIYTVYGSSRSGAGLEMADSSLIANGGRRNWSIVELTYDADGAGLNLDLSSYTKISLDISFEHVGLGRSTIFNVTLNDGENTKTVTKTWDVEQYNVNKPVDFLLSDFAGIDLDSIQSLMINMESDWSGQYEVFELFASDELIPEPATIVLLSLGVLLFVRKRR